MQLCNQHLAAYYTCTRINRYNKAGAELYCRQAHIATQVAHCCCGHPNFASKQEERKQQAWWQHDMKTQGTGSNGGGYGRDQDSSVVMVKEGYSGKNSSGHLPRQGSTLYHANLMGDNDTSKHSLVQGAQSSCSRKSWHGIDQSEVAWWKK